MSQELSESLQSTIFLARVCSAIAFGVFERLDLESVSVRRWFDRIPRLT